MRMAWKRGFAHCRSPLDFPRESRPWIVPVCRGDAAPFLGEFAPWNLFDFRGLQRSCKRRAGVMPDGPSGAGYVPPSWLIFANVTDATIIRGPARGLPSGSRDTQIKGIGCPAAAPLKQDVCLNVSHPHIPTYNLPYLHKRESQHKGQHPQGADFRQATRGFLSPLPPYLSLVSAAAPPLACP